MRILRHLDHATSRSSHSARPPFNIPFPPLSTTFLPFSIPSSINDDNIIIIQPHYYHHFTPAFTFIGTHFLYLLQCFLSILYLKGHHIRRQLTFDFVLLHTCVAWRNQTETNEMQISKTSYKYSLESEHCNAYLSKHWTRMSMDSPRKITLFHQLKKKKDEFNS